MNTLSCRPFSLALIGMALLTSLCLSPSFAQSPPEVADLSDSSESDSLREESIYIPYEKLREVFEREGRGVFLPYDRFMALWQAARDAKAPAHPDAPPVDALIVESDNQAMVKADVVQVNSTLRIELFNKGWHEIPLRLNDSAITQATIDGKPATIVHDPKRGYVLLYEKQNDAAQAIKVELQYARAIQKTPGQNSVAFKTPRAPVSKWRVVVPESQVKVNIHPLIAASEQPADENATNQTQLLAFVGAAPSVRLNWTPKAEGATGLAALVNVRATQQMRIDENVHRVRTQLIYDISRAALSQLVIAVPDAMKVTNVTDANVRQWSVAKQEDGTQHILVQLFEPALGRQSVLIQMEAFIEKSARQNVTVPIVQALNVGQQQGVVVVQTDPTMRTEVTRSVGLTQIDIPKTVRNWGTSAGGQDFAYRYNALPFELKLAVEQVEPRIVADTQIEAHLQTQQILLQAGMQIDVQRAGVFSFVVTIPADFEVTAVNSWPVGKNRALKIDGWHVDEQDPSKLTINLSARALGKVRLRVTLRQTLDEPNLLSPTGESVNLALSVPKLAGEHVDRQSGWLLVYSPESLRVQPGRLTGLRSGKMTQAMIDMHTRSSNLHTKMPTLIYTFGQEPASLELSVTRRQPYVTIAQLLSMQVEPGVVRYRASLRYNVQYSGVQMLRLDVPEALTDAIRIQTPGISESAMSPQPDDVEPGYVAWSLVGERDFLGSSQIQMTWEQPLETLEVGKGIDLPVPRLIPGNADRAWGQVVLIKSETIDLQPAAAPKHMRRIDPQADLIPNAGITNATQAFEFHQPWELTIQATQYELEEVKRTSIERGVVRMVQTRGDELAVQAIYRLQSARQRLSIQLPAGATFDTQPLRVNGREVMLERGGSDTFFIPLPSTATQSPVLVELRYTQTDSDAGQLTPPWFPEDAAVQKVYLAVYAPQERLLLGSRGPWTDENQWRMTVNLDVVPTADLSPEGLAYWVASGISDINPPDLVKDLATDGRRYLFSSLNPAPDAGLRLVMINSTLLHLLVFIIVVAGGAVLLRYDSRVKWLGVGGLVVGLILLGVFLPTFAIQVLDLTLVVAILIVLIVWTIWYLAVSRPNDPLVTAKREAKLAEAQARKQRAAQAMAQPAATSAKEAGHE